MNGAPIELLRKFDVIELASSFWSSCGVNDFLF